MPLNNNARWIERGERSVLACPGSISADMDSIQSLITGDFIKVGLSSTEQPSEVFWAEVIERMGNRIHAKINNDLVYDWGIDDGDNIIINEQFILLILKA